MGLGWIEWTHPRWSSTIMKMARTRQSTMINGQMNLQTRVQMYDRYAHDRGAVSKDLDKRSVHK